MEDCIFCKIIEAKIRSYKVYEDQDYLAILDTFPAVEGQVILLTKEHKDSNVFMLDDDGLTEMVLVAKKVAKTLKRKLDADKIQLIFAGTSVNHLHAKLYPTDQRITVEGKKRNGRTLNPDARQDSE